MSQSGLNQSLTHSLLRFAHIGLGYDRINVSEHGHILNMLEDEAKHQSLFDLNRDDRKHLMTQRVIQILLPRASYKTTIASISFPMWLLQQNPNLTIMLDSETYGLSKSILSEIKQQYSYGPYTNNFPAIEPKEVYRWAEDSIILPNRTAPKKEGSIAAAGLDGVKAGMHYDVIIADDLHSQNNTRNARQIAEVIEHYRLLLSILNTHGLLIVIGTRWAEDDAYTVIGEDANAKLFIPASSVKAMNIQSEYVSHANPLLVYDHISDTAVNANNFYLNFPTVLSLSHLEKIEKRQGAYIYSAQYLLKPVSDKEKRFREEWLHFYHEMSNAPLKGEKGYDPCIIRPLNFAHYRKVGLIDPAFTTAEYSDYTGIVCIASDSERNMYVQHADQYKLEPFQLIDKIFELQALYGINEWYVEEVAAQKVLRFFLEYMMAKEDKQCYIGPVKSFGKKKSLRVMGLQPYFANSKIYLKEDQEVLLHQIRRFPILKNDDVLDALAYAPQVIFDGDAPTPLTYRNPHLTMGDLIKENKERNQESTGLRPRGFTNSWVAKENYYA